jgi:segregation and condensation protein B
MEPHPLKRIIEAALLAAAHPLTLSQISALFDAWDTPSNEDLTKAIAELQSDCAQRGVELVEVASGFRYQVRRDVHAFVSRLWAERQMRYSRALLETLALIAYRQPITRAEIEQVRGVAVSTHIVRTLEEREWIRVVGHRDLPGKPALFGTTKQFLDYFNLKALDELPSLSEIHDIEELYPQLALEEAGDAIPAALAAADQAAVSPVTDHAPPHDDPAEIQELDPQRALEEAGDAIPAALAAADEATTSPFTDHASPHDDPAGNAPQPSPQDTDMDATRNAHEDTPEYTA